MASPSDPFHTAERDLSALLSSTRALLASYTRISTTASPTSPEVLSARADLTASLSDLTTDLQDLIDAVQAVEGAPSRYGLDVAEVERRRRFVRDVGAEIAGMRGQAERPGGGLPSPGAFEVGGVNGDGDGEEDGYAAFEEQQQQEILHQQDEQLDGVFRTVGNLRMQADEMGRELEEQGELLDTVDTLADRVGGKLQVGLKKVGWVIKKNEDTASSCCIAILITALIIMLVLVIIL